MMRIRAFALSSLVHAAVLGVGSMTWLLTVAPVPAPPLTIRFIPGPPLAKLAWPSSHPRRETPPGEAIATPLTERARRRPTPAAVGDPAERPTAADPAIVDSALLTPTSPAVIRPASLVVGNEDRFIPPAPTARYLPAGQPPGLTTGVVERVAPGTVGVERDAPGVESLQQVASSGSSGALEPGGRGGTLQRLAARMASLPPGDRELSTNGRPTSDGNPGALPGPDDSEPEIIAQTLGRRYHLELLDARELGHSTHDGWRYSQLLPLLSEAYRTLASRKAMVAADHGPGEDVRSMRIDPDAIAIAYADGTRHVVAPTRDGLVALYVTTGAIGRTKVDEIRRALGALRRMLNTQEHS